jgi:hypothetical protein
MTTIAKCAFLRSAIKIVSMSVFFYTNLRPAPLVQAVAALGEGGCPGHRLHWPSSST